MKEKKKMNVIIMTIILMITLVLVYKFSENYAYNKTIVDYISKNINDTN